MSNVPDFWMGSDEGYERLVKSMSEQIEKDLSLEELFPFEYKGGGYFRMKGVAKGKSAEMLHGMEAVKYLYEKMRECIPVSDEACDCKETLEG